MNYSKIPHELKKLKQWASHNAKQPVTPNGLVFRWGNHKMRWEFTDIQHLNKIGFFFHKEDPYVGIDLDKCIENGKLKNWASEIMDKFKTYAYAEISPSGRGIHIYIRGSWDYANEYDENGIKIEVYSERRFFTVTGKGKGKIHPDGAQESLDWLANKYFTPLPPEPPKPTPIKKEFRDDHPYHALEKSTTANPHNYLTNLGFTYEKRGRYKYHASKEPSSIEINQDGVITVHSATLLAQLPPDLYKSSGGKTRQGIHITRLYLWFTYNFDTKTATAEQWKSMLQKLATDGFGTFNHRKDNNERKPKHRTANYSYTNRRRYYPPTYQQRR